MTYISNRIKGPTFEKIDNIAFLPVTKFALSNGIETALITAGSQEVTKIDWIFPAGAVQAGKVLLASTVGNLLLEGTKTKSSLKISELLDFYGARLSPRTYYHNTVITLLCLTKYLDKLLPLVQEIIIDAAFDQKEIDIYLNKKRQEFIMNTQKVKTLAFRRFNEVVFGSSHPYGRQVQIEHFDLLSRDDLIKFHQEAYSPLNTRIVVAGQPGKNIKSILNRYFGSKDWALGKNNLNAIEEIQPMQEKFFLIEKDDSLQSAIYIGRPMFNNHHPDFIPLQILNTLLGGYFGSRLMTSLREEKGLTYGVGSDIRAFKYGGLWAIASEVMGEKRQLAIAAIREEMIKLSKDAVSDNELEIVKNYMLGELLRNFDGPFLTSDIFRTLWEFGLDFEYYGKLIDEINNISKEKILSLGKQYLNHHDFYVVVAGK